MNPTFIAATARSDPPTTWVDAAFQCTNLECQGMFLASYRALQPGGVAFSFQAVAPRSATARSWVVRTLWRLASWTLLIVGSIALVQLAATRRQELVDISYSQFVQELERGNIAAVEITGRQQLKGMLKIPAVVGRRTTDRFATRLPFELSDSWVAKLREKGVDVWAREEKQSFGGFLIGLLP
jgi:hypothetical protein